MDDVPSSASLSVNGDTCQRNVTYLFDDQGILSWVHLSVLSEPHSNVEVPVAKPMHSFLGESESVSQMARLIENLTK